jgi:hypothetical protein
MEKAKSVIKVTFNFYEKRSFFEEDYNNKYKFIFNI